MSDSDPPSVTCRSDPSRAGGVSYRRLERDSEMPAPDLPEVEDDPLPDAWVDAE